MALTSNLVNGRRAKAHRRQVNMAPARAGEIFYVGSALSIDAAGRIVNGAGGVRAAGIAVEPIFPEEPRKNVHLDNRNGSDGAWQGDQCLRGVRYDQVGEYHFTNVLGAPTVGGNAYLIDDDTVSADAIAGGIIFGEFTQNKDGGWYVDISKKNAGLRAATDDPVDLVAPVWATLAPDSPPVKRSDVIQISLTNRAAFNVQAGADNAREFFFGIAAEDAVPGDTFLVWRGGHYPTRVKDGEVLIPYLFITWENTGVRWIQVGDATNIGRTLEGATGGVGEIIMCEIWWPPLINWP